MKKKNGKGVGKWIVRDKSQGNLKWLGGLLGERLKPLNDRQRGWFQAFRKEIKGPRGEKEFETPYDCAVAVYERIKELLVRGSRAGDDETVAQVANIMLRSAPVVEYGTLLRTPRFLEKIVFGERYYEALKRSGDDDDRKQWVRSELRRLPRQIAGWVMNGDVVDQKIVHPKLPYLISKDEGTGTKEQLEQRLRGVVEEVMGTFEWLE